MTVHFLQLTLPGGKPVIINVAQVVSIAESIQVGKANVFCMDGRVILVNETLDQIRDFGAVDDRPLTGANARGPK
jgi:hypothetical protein